MSDPEDIVRTSPVGFEDAVAYALHPAMRRLIILYVVGTLLVPTGFSLMVSPPGGIPAIGLLAGLALTIIGAIFLFGGLVGTLFKLVVDANLLAHRNGSA